MGFYPPDALVHEAQRRGIEILPPDVNVSEVECRVETTGAAAGSSGNPPVRVGLGLRDRADGGRCRGAGRGARAGRPLSQRLGPRRPLRRRGGCAAAAGLGRGLRFAGRGRCGAGRSRSGSEAAGALGSRRRLRGPLAPARERSWRCARRFPHSAHCPPLGPWERIVADYRTTGMTLGKHPMELLRDGLPAEVLSSEPRPHPGRGAREGRRDGRRAPAPGDRQRGRLHAARGRERDDQPDRAAAGVRALPAGGADLRIRAGRGQARAPRGHDQRGGLEDRPAPAARGARRGNRGTSPRRFPARRAGRRRCRPRSPSAPSTACGRRRWPSWPRRCQPRTASAGVGASRGRAWWS